ncbi:MAG: MarR family transcriptional regulator [Spirochaetales bacterium]|nr:MarR family transcriptional regulator [Spirochaetales bacterium]
MEWENVRQAFFSVHSQLTQLMHIDKGTTSKAVQKLIKIGYIKKMQDDTDNRIQRLYPTDLAKGTYPKLIEKEEHFIYKSLSNFSEEDKKTVIRLIEQMRLNIENEWLEKRVKREI